VVAAIGELLEIVLDARQACRGDATNLGDRALLFGSEQLGDLSQAEAERFAPSYECEAPPIGVGVLAISGGRSRRFGQDALTLIETNGLDVYTCGSGELADRHRRAGGDHADVQRVERDRDSASIASRT